MAVAEAGDEARGDALRRELPHCQARESRPPTAVVVLVVSPPHPFPGLAPGLRLQQAGVGVRRAAFSRAQVEELETTARGVQEAYGNPSLYFTRPGEFQEGPYAGLVHQVSHVFILEIHGIDVHL